MDYDGSNCTCIHSPSLVSLIHLFHGTTDLKQQSCTLTHLQLLSCMRSSLLFPPVSLVHSHFILSLIWINSHSTMEVTWMCEYWRLIIKQTAFCLWKTTEIFDWIFFLFVTCSSIAPCCIHMGSLSHIEGRGGYWFSHCLCSSFGNWKHAVCRKRDLELVCKSWNVLLHWKKKLTWLLLQNVKSWKCSVVSVSSF